MKKPYRFHQLSKLKCAVVGCKKLIKMNVLSRKDPDKPLICFKHYISARRRGLNTRLIPWTYHLERRPYA